MKFITLGSPAKRKRFGCIPLPDYRGHYVTELPKGYAPNAAICKVAPVNALPVAMAIWSMFSR